MYIYIIITTTVVVILDLLPLYNSSIKYIYYIYIFITLSCYVVVRVQGTLYIIVVCAGPVVCRCEVGRCIWILISPFFGIVFFLIVEVNRGGKFVLGCGHLNSVPVRSRQESEVAILI